MGCFLLRVFLVASGRRFFALGLWGVFCLGSFEVFWSPNPLVSGVGGKVGFSSSLFLFLLAFVYSVCPLCAFLQVLLINSSYLLIKKIK